MSVFVNSMGSISAIILIACFAYSTATLPENLKPEIYCSGCQATIKELSRYLKHKTNDPIDSRVSKMVRGACNEDHFKYGEYSPKQMKEACEHLIKSHRKDIEDALIEYYTERDRRHLTYLDIVQQVCSNRTKACYGSTDDQGDNKKGKIVYNPKTEQFDIFPGENVKIAQPSRHLSDEL